MVYIITSKTRRKSPNGRQVQMERPSNDGEIRICDEREAEKNLKRPGWEEPKPIPGVTGTDKL